MLAVPKIPRLKEGSPINFRLMNHMIRRIEYAAKKIKAESRLKGNGTGVMASGYLVASNPNLDYGPSGVFNAGYVFNLAVPTIAIITTPQYREGNYFSGQNFVFNTAYTGTLDGISVSAGFSLRIKYLGRVILAIEGPKVVNNVNWKGSGYDLPNLSGGGFEQFWSADNWYATEGFREFLPLNTEWIIGTTRVKEIGIGVRQR